MTPQQAYNKGLDDAENRVIQILKTLVKGEEFENFQNPELAKVVDILKIRNEYYYGLAVRNNNIGKTFRKRIAEQNQTIDI